MYKYIRVSLRRSYVCLIITDIYPVPITYFVKIEIRGSVKLYT